MRRYLAFVLAIACVLATGYSCGGSSTKDASAGEQALAAALKDLGDDGGHVDGYDNLSQDLDAALGADRSAFNKTDLAQIEALGALRQQAGAWSTQQARNVPVATAAAVTDNRIVDLAAAVEKKLDDITTDAVIGTACQTILNIATPGATPQPGTEASEWGLAADQLVAAAKAALIKAVTGPFDVLFSWHDWFDSVTATAGQVSSALQAQPTGITAQILTNPAGQRAAIAYVDWCLTPPLDAAP